ncbi:hypothetical protein F8B91_05855 [Aestuariivirga litoralis]|nr:hypothetical protein [Aestuariivirga litoralis]
MAAAESSQHSRRSSTRVGGIAIAKAEAKSKNGRLWAHAEATVIVAGQAQTQSANAVALNVGHSQATAISSKHQTIAYAESASGGYAAAQAGLRGYRIASVPNGVVQDGNMNGHAYEVAYDAEGNFSFAMTADKTAAAFAGSTSEVGAFADGNVQVALSSATFAGAFASPRVAWAFASAWFGGLATASGGMADARIAMPTGGFSSVQGGAWAFAMVEHVPTVQNSQCSRNFWPDRKKLQFERCDWVEPTK